jgi:hypothetical protein
MLERGADQRGLARARDHQQQRPLAQAPTRTAEVTHVDASFDDQRGLPRVAESRSHTLDPLLELGHSDRLDASAKARELRELIIDRLGLARLPMARDDSIGVIT